MFELESWNSTDWIKWTHILALFKEVYVWGYSVHTHTSRNDNQIVKNNFTVSLNRTMSCFILHVICFFEKFFEQLSDEFGSAWRSKYKNNIQTHTNSYYKIRPYCVAKTHNLLEKYQNWHRWATRAGWYFLLTYNRHINKVWERKTKTTHRRIEWQQQQRQKINEFIDVEWLEHGNKITIWHMRKKSHFCQTILGLTVARNWICDEPVCV